MVRQYNNHSSIHYLWYEWNVRSKEVSERDQDLFLPITEK